MKARSTSQHTKVRPAKERARLPDVAELRAAFDYNPGTGELFHKVSRPQVVAGTLATTNNGSGYLAVRVRGHAPFQAHRVAWAVFYGRWPASMVDHINRDRRDNRIENLRETDYRINAENRLVASSSSGTGLIGVGLHRASGLYRGRIGVRGKDISLGYFRTAQEAHDAYIKAKRVLHSGFVE